MNNSSKMIYYYGTMDSGKTLELLKEIFNLKKRNKRVALLKPNIDKRTENKVFSRIGLEETCDLFSVGENLYNYIKENYIGCHTIFIDEAQFLSQEQVWQLREIVQILNINIEAYGLKTDFQGNLFEGSKALLALSDQIIEKKGRCWCGDYATMNLRISNEKKVLTEGEQIETGFEDKYVSVCFKHWYEKKIMD